MTARVRRATPEDADELARLRWAFRVEHATPVNRTFAEFLEEFRAFVGDVLGAGGSWRVWVAEQDGRLVGCTWVQLVEKVPHPSRKRWERPIAYLTNVYVEPELRDRGLGGRLLGAAIEHAREHEVSEAVVWPTERSVPFYERAGFGVDGGPHWLDVTGD